MKIFLSYNFDDLPFVTLVYKHLRQQPDMEPYFFSSERTSDDWQAQVRHALVSSEAIVVFVGNEIGDTQRHEFEVSEISIEYKMWVQLSENPPEAQTSILRGLNLVRTDPINVTMLVDDEALKCAQEIMRVLEVRWVPPDGIPVGYPFEYEKDIIQAFRSTDEGSIDERIPETWPDVERRDIEAWADNPVPPQTIGAYREDGACVLVDARSREHGDELVFPEAGPRRQLCYPISSHTNYLKVGILVSGGIAPGINAVIDGIVKRHHLYANPPHNAGYPEPHYDPYDLEIFGYLEGFKALLRGAGNHISLTPDQTETHAHEGGSILGTSRVQELMDSNTDKRMIAIQKVLSTLAAERIEILYVIGGDGSMRAAHAIWSVAQKTRPDLNLSIVAVPKTMDNDILWVWQSFGFLSAVEKSRETVLHLQTEVTSNPRLGIIQLFGSDSGFVVAHTVLASGGCDYALIPEVGFSLETLCDYMKTLLVRRLSPQRGQRPHGIIVMSETAIPRDVEKYINEVDLSREEREAIERFACIGMYAGNDTFNWRVQGQTPDELRTGGLKIVAQTLQRQIRSINGNDGYWKDFRVFTNEPRHIIRASPPSAIDVIFGQRLGALAVDNAMAGYTDFMVSQWLTEYVLVPLKLVVLGRKRVPSNGIFWKSVLASTGQPMES